MVPSAFRKICKAFFLLTYIYGIGPTIATIPNTYTVRKVLEDFAVFD